MIEAKYVTNYQKLPDFGYKTYDNIKTNLHKLREQLDSETEGDGPLSRNYARIIRSTNKHIYGNVWACFKTMDDTPPDVHAEEKKKFFKKVQEHAKTAELSWHGKKDTPHLAPVFDDKLVHLGGGRYRVTLKAGFWVSPKQKKNQE